MTPKRSTNYFRQAKSRWVTNKWKCTFTALIVLIALLVTSLFATTHVVYAAGNTYYVATNGSDNSPGTQSQPWLTLQKAASTVVAGDTVFIRAGIYNERLNVTNKFGTASQRITFENYSNENPVIDGTGLGTLGAIYIDSSSYITIDGLEVQNTAGAGVQASYGENHYLEFLNMTVHDCGTDAFNIGYPYHFGQVTNILISGCNLYNLCKSDGADRGLSITSVDSFEVKNSTIADTNGHNGLDALVGSTNGKIDHNEFARSSLYIDAFGQPTSNIDVYDNYIHDAPFHAILLGCEQHPASVTNINFYNNLFYNNHQGALVVYGEAGGFTTLTFSFVNNTCYENAGSGWADIRFGDATSNYSSCVIANNIIVCATDNTPPIINKYHSNGTTVDHNLLFCANGTLYPEVTDVIHGTNAIIANPLLVNPPTDFSIASNSPAINAASSTLAPTTDYAGTSRSQGAG